MGKGWGRKFEKVSHRLLFLVSENFLDIEQYAFNKIYRTLHPKEWTLGMYAKSKKKKKLFMRLAHLSMEWGIWRNNLTLLKMTRNRFIDTENKLVFAREKAGWSYGWNRWRKWRGTNVQSDWSYTATN